MKSVHLRVHLTVCQALRSRYAAGLALSQPPCGRAQLEVRPQSFAICADVVGRGGRSDIAPFTPPVLPRVHRGARRRYGWRAAGRETRRSALRELRPHCHLLGPEPGCASVARGEADTHRLSEPCAKAASASILFAGSCSTASSPCNRRRSCGTARRGRWASAQARPISRAALATTLTRVVEACLAHPGRPNCVARRFLADLQRTPKELLAENAPLSRFWPNALSGPGARKHLSECCSSAPKRARSVAKVRARSASDGLAPRARFCRVEGKL